MSDQIARLQAAVKEMLADINVDAAEKLSGFDGYDGQDVEIGRASCRERV